VEVIRFCGGDQTVEAIKSRGKSSWISSGGDCFDAPPFCSSVTETPLGIIACLVAPRWRCSKKSDQATPVGFTGQESKKERLFVFRRFQIAGGAD
jgi:hypothetical protein